MYEKKPVHGIRKSAVITLNLFINLTNIRKQYYRSYQDESFLYFPSSPIFCSSNPASDQKVIHL